MSNKDHLEHELETYLAVLMNCPVLVLASAIKWRNFFLDEEELGPHRLVTLSFLNGAFNRKILSFTLASEQRMNIS